MDIKKEREAFEKSYAEMLIGEELKGLESVIFAKYLESGEYAQDKVDTAWCMWQSAKAQAVQGKDAIIKKLSDQLYSQEMKTSAARTLCETACELLDDYAHQDAMVILNDLEQAMIETQEQNQ